MKKYEIRKVFFKLKNRGHSYVKCRTILKAKYEYDITVRTLKRWIKRLDSEEWNLLDNSRRPHTIHRKVTPKIEQEVLSLRDKTRWGCDKIAIQLTHLNISRVSINRILCKHNLCRETTNKGKQKKWVRWQRHHPNSLWQIDHTDEQELFDCYTLSVLDDCSRYSLALVKLKHVTTRVVTHVLDELIKKHGTPKQILSDNGSAYGSKSKHSRFDCWCRRKGIQHIRTKVHSPTTNGKVERLFRTMDD
ncbi:MAG: DDE-type integrase/transposase/recombinase, partial [Nanoarchaeota archaeon]|nr:DDE-type integrase/transposase/recombinase [Nanoarchaeota archaeon]